ncbi:MAG: polysaccharide deacetylase family protein [Eubacteriales bacterium]|nr:polysaccharide deacetylase family protein [Eubacteriales bacterium]
MRRRKIIRLATYAAAMVLAVVFVVRGIILPIARRISGKDASQRVEVQANAAMADPNTAIRQPLKGEGDVGKISQRTVGWHMDEEGRWYQNPDSTYYASGIQEIDGVKYCFNDQGYVKTGWVTIDAKDYYFDSQGNYDPTQKRTLLALTFDDGPGAYTDELLDCLEENNSRATFFMLGQNVENYQSTVKRMAEMGCEIGSHSWDHQNLRTLDQGGVKKEFEDTDDALIRACGQPASVARAPYGEWDQNIVETVGKPFFMWSTDSRDWEFKDAQRDYDSVMGGDLTDGSIILMHDIHQPTVEAVKRFLPELVEQGYKLVTLSEMAAAKGVALQTASYSDFWQSSIDAGRVPGAGGGEESAPEEVSDGSEETYSDGEGDPGVSDGSETGGEYSDG